MYPVLPPNLVLTHVPGTPDWNIKRRNRPHSLCAWLNNRSLVAGLNLRVQLCRPWWWVLPRKLSELSPWADNFQRPSPSIYQTHAGITAVPTVSWMQGWVVLWSRDLAWLGHLWPEQVHEAVNKSGGARVAQEEDLSFLLSEGSGALALSGGWHIRLAYAEWHEVG